METQWIKLNPRNPETQVMEPIAQALFHGELVAFPTETVYGLGANGLDDAACRQVFAIKKRPADNPLILHIAEQEDVLRLCRDIPPEATVLMSAFWPGPLTLIMKKRPCVPNAVTGGGETVAVRMPAHPIARQLIALAGCPIAAPSANLSGKPSPTNAQDCRDDLDGAIYAIIDGGDCEIGIESTVLDISEKPFRILRPGFYTPEDFEMEGIRAVYDDSILKDGLIPRSPGQKYKHYAPQAEVAVFVGTEEDRWCKLMRRACEEKEKGRKIGYLIFEEHEKEIPEPKISLGSSALPAQMANRLFSALRQMDREQVDIILVEGLPEKGLGLSVMNRLKKSASGQMI